MAAQTLSLRPYQRAAVDRAAATTTRLLIIAPTGAGKTAAQATYIQESGQPALVVVPREEIALQTVDVLSGLGVDAALCLGKYPRRVGARVQVGTAVSLLRSNHVAPVVVVDEAHLAPGAYTAALLEANRGAQITGWTATPWRLDGTPLPFDDAYVMTTAAELVATGHLVPLSGYQYLAPDLHGVRRSGGDFSPAESAERMSGLNGDIYAAWKKHAEGLRTIVFATTVPHAKALASAWPGGAVVVTAGTPTATRRERIRRAPVVVNVGVATLGTDVPAWTCCVLARPTASWTLYVQMLGRVRRPYVGKTHALLLDHAGGWAMHGSPDAPLDFDPLGGIVRRPVTTASTGLLCPYCAETPCACELGRRARRLPTAAPEAAELPLDVVSLRWIPKRVGQTLQGRLREKRDGWAFWGVCREYVVGNRVVTGYGDIRMKLEGVSIGDEVRLEYLGDDDQKRKRFAVLRKKTTH